MQEGIVLLVRLDALIERFYHLAAYGGEERLARAVSCFGTHQHADLFQALPFPVQGEQRADLEKSGRNIEGPSDTGPLLEITLPGPAGNTVIDDEEAVACGVSVHSVLSDEAQTYPSLPPRFESLENAESLDGQLRPSLASPLARRPSCKDGCETGATPGAGWHGPCT